MLLTLDFSLDTPIYQQIRNQIVLGIAEGKLRPHEKLPPIRQLAIEIGVNTMTVNKAYQLLKQEGYLVIDRRNGAMVSDTLSTKIQSLQENDALRLLLSEFYVCGVSKENLLNACEQIYDELTESAQKKELHKKGDAII